jgi:hypothetical protein
MITAIACGFAATNVSIISDKFELLDPKHVQQDQFSMDFGLPSLACAMLVEVF